jgi:hypothetical protein
VPPPGARAGALPHSARWVEITVPFDVAIPRGGPSDGAARLTRPVRRRRRTGSRSVEAASLRLDVVSSAPTGNPMANPSRIGSLVSRMFPTSPCRWPVRTPARSTGRRGRHRSGRGDPSVAPRSSG